MCSLQDVKTTFDAGDSLPQTLSSGTDETRDENRIILDGIFDNRGQTLGVFSQERDSKTSTDILKR